MFLAFLAALLADPSALPGFYLSQGTDVAAGIELYDDGTFLYSFEQGPRSENAEGRWSVEGEQLILTVVKSPGSLEPVPFKRLTLAIQGPALEMRRDERVIRMVREELPPIRTLRNPNLEKGN